MPGCTSKPGAALRAVIRPDMGLDTTRVGSTWRSAIMRSISASVLPKMRTASRAARSAPSAVCWSETACSRSFWEIARVSNSDLQARQVAVGELQDACRRDQGRAGLQQVGAVDGEQELALLDLVADLGEQPDDPSLVGGEDLGQQLLVEIDAADRALLDGKVTLLDRCDLDGFELGLRKLDAVGGRRRIGAPLGRRIGGSDRIGDAALELGCAAVVDGKIHAGGKAQHRHSRRQRLW